MLAPTRRSSWLALAGIIAAFALLRGPVLWHAPGGIDEDLFAVPGWTVWNEGIPRIPYEPPRAAATGFRDADVALYSLPPLYFYWSAPFHGAIGPGYPAARVASAVAGAGAIGLVFLIGRAAGMSAASALAAAGLYSLSRAVYFPATYARPDMVCGALQLAAVWVFLKWRVNPEWRRLVVCGALLGLAGLAHPVALVAAIQLGIMAPMTAGSAAQKVGRFALLAAAALLTAAMWLILIAQHPALFQEQFSQNVLSPAGPGLGSRLLAPWRGVAAQYAPTLERLGPLQLAMGAVGALGALAVCRRSAAAGFLGAMAAGGVLLLTLLLNERHPAMGYWCYPAAFWLLGLTHLAEVLSTRPGFSRSNAVWACWAFLLLCHLPGSGLRTSWAAYQNWNECKASRACFVGSLLDHLPPGDRYLVDAAYVFDVWATGRDTTLAKRDPDEFLLPTPPYDILIVSRLGLRSGIPELTGAEYLYSAGAETPFTCYAEVYRSPVESPP